METADKVQVVSSHGGGGDSDDAIETQQQVYGFDFKRANAGGLGAALHAIMLALHYARSNNHTFAFVKEGFHFPRLNGTVDDMGPDTPDHNFHSYFSSFPTLVNEDATVAVWHTCPNGSTREPPATFSAAAVDWYAGLMQEIFQLQPCVAAEVERRIAKTPFCADTDLVLHIRRGDKIFKSAGSVVESGELPVSEYLEYTCDTIARRLPNVSRVYLCTDDKSIIEPLAVDFAARGITLVYDATEPAELLQAQRLAGQLTKSAALEENLVALTNLVIMSRGRGLVGGRMSYFFRVAELLNRARAGAEAVICNMKDNEKFGVAPYAEKGEHMVNPFYARRYLNFVAPDIEFNTPRVALECDYIVTVPDFMAESAATQVLTDMRRFKREWWSHSVIPTTAGWTVRHHTHNDPQLAENVRIANKAADAGHFAYYFKRTCGGHFDTCRCFSCRLVETFNSYEVMKALSRIVGKRVVSVGECFASLYERDNFLTLHHDKNKGHYTFILALSKDWNPTHGGLTHFYDAHTSSIYKSVSPRFNTLTVFKLTPERQMDHFVSRVCGPGSRYAFTGWFFVEDQQ